MSERHGHRPGHAQFAKALDDHVNRRMRRPPPLDFGTITAEGLAIDGFGPVWPKGGILVDERFNHPDTAESPWEMNVGAPMTSPSFPGSPAATGVALHYHQMPLPPQFRPLEAGDRVLLVWLDHDGDSPTPVVIARLVSA